MEKKENEYEYNDSNTIEKYMLSTVISIKESNIYNYFNF